MFANTVNRRTRTIISRPVSLALSIDTELETVSEISSPSSKSSFTSTASSKSSFTTHSNDSAATLVNDILVMQIAKESKDYEPSISVPLEDQHPLLRPQDQHPLLRQQSAPELVVPRTRKANRSSQHSPNNRYSWCSTKSQQSSRSTRRDGGRGRYSTMPLVVEMYEG